MSCPPPLLQKCSGVSVCRADPWPGLRMCIHVPKVQFWWICTVLSINSNFTFKTVFSIQVHYISVCFIMFWLYIRFCAFYYLFIKEECLLNAVNVICSSSCAHSGTGHSGMDKDCPLQSYISDFVVLQFMKFFVWLHLLLHQSNNTFLCSSALLCMIT